jgi:FkbM family methyltransferase
MAYPVWLARRVRRAFRSLGFSIRRIGIEEPLQESSPFQWNGFQSFVVEMTKVAPPHPNFNFVDCMQCSKSQLGQDVIAAWLFGNSGFFVEFGAADGKYLSNSYALEKIGWHGVLAEPNKHFHSLLAQNRPVTPLEKNCVWSASGDTLEFVETFVGELATVKEFVSSDEHDRSDAKTYLVNTIAFEDFLSRYNAPETIHYLSIDTEGSEFTILQSLDWSCRRFGFISVEHNYTPNREKIADLLSAQGYRRFGEVFSLFDDWYFHPIALANLRGNG